LKQWRPLIISARGLIYRHCHKKIIMKELKIFIQATVLLMVATANYSIAGTVTINLTSSRLTGVAPLSVFFNTDSTTSSDLNSPADAFRELNYSWDFNDPGASFENRPGVDATTAKGPLAAHVFDQPGTYQVKLDVTDQSGGSASQTVQIVVTDPDTAYTQTHCVSNTNNFVDCPSGNSSDHIVSSDFSAEAAWAVQSPGRRVLFHRGETFIAVSTISLGNAAGPMEIGAYGIDNGTNDPIITPGNNGLFQLGDGQDIRITQLQFIGAFDPTTGFGVNITLISSGSLSQPKHFLFYRNRNIGNDNTFSASGGSTNPTQKYLILADNDISSWQNYGMFFRGSESAILGNSIRQHPGTISGQGAKCAPCSPDYADHGPIRVPAADNLLISGNNMASRNGWSSNGRGIQPTLRLAPNLNQMEVRILVSGNFMDNGGSHITLNPPNAAAVGGLDDIIIENNTFVAGHKSGSSIGVRAGGVTIRDNLFVKRAVGGTRNMVIQTGAGKYLTAIQFLPPDAALILDKQNYIHGNTLVSYDLLANNTVFLFVQAPQAYKISFKNNIAYLPNVDGVSSAGGVDGGLIQWNNPATFSGLSSENNIYYAPNSLNRFATFNDTAYDLVSWRALGHDLTSSTVDPQFANVPDFCSDILIEEVQITGANVAPEPGGPQIIDGSGTIIGTRTILTHPAIDFEKDIGVKPNYRLRFTSGLSGVSTIVYVAGNTLTLESSYVNSQTAVSFDVMRSLSNESRLYLRNTSQFIVSGPGNGFKIIYNDDNTPRDVTATSSDSNGAYIDISPAFTGRPSGEICGWYNAASYVKNYSIDPVAIDDVKQDALINVGFEFFPNPFTGQATIKFISPSQFAMVEIFSLKGGKVAQVSVNKNNSIHWDASDLAGGIYFVKLISSDKIVERKIFLIK